MNQSQLQGSINRYSKKRKSYDIMKSSNGIKNGKKSLPQVFIDLNHPAKKGKLTIDERHNRLKEQLNSNCQVSHFNDGKTNDKNKKIAKKESICLKNLYNTQHLRNDENKNILNQYRDEIQLLKMDNQRLREENQKLKLNQQYNLRRIKEEKEQKHVLIKQNEQLRFTNEKMEERMNNYEGKIKGLFQQLIYEKKQRYGIKEEQKGQIAEQIVFTTLNSENNRGKTKGELGSYRQINQRYGIYENQIDKFKRLTSPSSHSRGKYDKNRWYEQHKEYFKRQQQKGEAAYYKNQKYREGSRNNTVYYQD